jgi:hypothetical protein
MTSNLLFAGPDCAAAAGSRAALMFALPPAGACQEIGNTVYDRHARRLVTNHWLPCKGPKRVLEGGKWHQV